MLWKRPGGLGEAQVANGLTVADGTVLDRHGRRLGAGAADLTGGLFRTKNHAVVIDPADNGRMTTIDLRTGYRRDVRAKPHLATTVAGRNRLYDPATKNPGQFAFDGIDGYDPATGRLEQFEYTFPGELRIFGEFQMAVTGDRVLVDNGQALKAYTASR